MNKPMQIPVLKALVCVVDRSLRDPLLEALQESHMRVHFRASARGTAGSDMLDLLGLGDEDKVFVCGLTADYFSDRTLSEITSRLSLKNPGTGIAFTIPITGISGTVVQAYTQEIEKMKEMKEKVEQHMEKDALRIQEQAGHALVVVVANQGYSEDIIHAAKVEGATGGTILAVRRGGTDALANYIGITIQAEKELVFILTTREMRPALMRAISKEFGIHSNAKGFVLSMPVDSVAGFGVETE